MSNLYQQGMQQQAPYQSSYYPQSVVKIPSNPIGDEGIRTLMSTNNKILFNVTKKDIWEILCYHTHNGEFRVTRLEPGRNIFRCDICKEIINLEADISDKDLEAAVALLMIAWQQAKCYNYGVVSADIMYDHAQALAVMKKFPQLFKFIMTNFRQNSVQLQQTQTSIQNVGQAAYNAIHSTTGFGYNPVYNYGSPTMVQSQAVGNPFQATIQQPVMYVPQQQQMQPQVIVQPQYPPQQQQPPIVMQPQYQPQQQITYSYEQPQQPMQPQYQPVNQQQPPMPQNVPPPAATGTVVPEQAPPVAYPPKGQQVPVAGQNDSVKRALGFNL